LWQIETFVTFCGMVRLRVVAGEGLRSVGAAPTSPIQERVLYLAPRSLFIRPGDPSEVSISRPLAERREMVDVALGTNILGFPMAAYDVGIDGPRTEIVVDGYEDDTYEDVAWQICRALAVLGFRGEVRLFCDAGAEEEEKREIFANVGHLTGVLWLTDEYAAGVAAEEVEQAEKEDADFGRIMRFMQEEGLRRGLNKEEREQLTLGEAFKDPEGQ
jgi:hypothetical protein